MKFYFDFTGWCTIEAESEEEAQDKFWDLVGESNLPESIFEIEGIEEIAED